jgi:hypothetical protein
MHARPTTLRALDAATWDRGSSGRARARTGRLLDAAHRVLALTTPAGAWPVDSRTNGPAYPKRVHRAFTVTPAARSEEKPTRRRGRDRANRPLLVWHRLASQAAAPGSPARGALRTGIWMPAGCAKRIPSINGVAPQDGHQRDAAASSRWPTYVLLARRGHGDRLGRHQPEPRRSLRHGPASVRWWWSLNPSGDLPLRGRLPRAIWRYFLPASPITPELFRGASFWLRRGGSSSEELPSRRGRLAIPPSLPDPL